MRTAAPGSKDEYCLKNPQRIQQISNAFFGIPTEAKAAGFNTVQDTNGPPAHWQHWDKW